MIKLNNLYKGAGKGKIAAIIGITSPISFTKLGIKNVGMELYRQYLINYVGYDNVYIISSSIKEKKINEDYFDKSSIVFGIDRENLFNELNIDDIFCKQNVLIFFGGVLGDYVFSILNRLAEWYRVHGDGHYYTIQDDPDFLTFNPAKFIENRLYKNDEQKPKPFKYDRNTKDALMYNNNMSDVYNCLDNTIIAHCGVNYESFYNKRIQLKFGSPNYIPYPAKYWDTFNCYNWQGVNCNLLEKFKDYDLSNKKYQCEYHGYIKHDDKRVKTTLDFYNALTGPNKIIQAKGIFSSEFKNAETFGEVPYNDLFEFISKDSYSTFITANESVFNDFISPRYFDLMMSDIIAFVYTPYDEYKRYTDNDELKEFMYVDDPNDFKQKVEKLINDDSFYRHIKYLQRKSIYDNFNDYMTISSKEMFEQYLNDNKHYG